MCFFVVGEFSDCAQGGGKLDVVVALDSSTSITRENFRKTLDFLSRFAFYLVTQQNSLYFWFHHQILSFKVFAVVHLLTLIL